MLIITRRVNEATCIGEDIRIVVLGMNRGQVKLGVEAPRDVEILRDELVNNLAEPPDE